MAALSAAFLWALATVCFGWIGRSLSARTMNLTKNVLAVFMLLAAVKLMGDGFRGLPVRVWGWLLLSGAIGIGIGDTAFFGSIHRLGARRALLLGTLAPPLAAMLAFLFLAERLGWQAWCGMALTLSGVMWVIMEQEAGYRDRVRNLWGGFALGMVAALAQAIGVVLSRAALSQSAVSPLVSAVIRLCAGAMILMVWIGMEQGAGSVMFRWRHWPWRVWVMIVFTTFIAAFLGLWLQQVSLKHATAGISQTLISTSPVFVLPIVAVAGERVTWRGIMGAVVAIAGVAVLLLAPAA
jgi:drug/metabolite transporter (DMT)-like permease